LVTLARLAGEFFWTHSHYITLAGARAGLSCGGKKKHELIRAAFNSMVCGKRKEGKGATSIVWFKKGLEWGISSRNEMGGLLSFETAHHDVLAVQLGC